MSLEAKIHQASRAKEVLDNEVYQQAFTDYKTEIIKQWETSPARDEDGRQRLWLMLATLNKVQSMLQTTMETGKLAAQELEHKKSIADRLKESLGMTL
ncbi:hypothetical protein [Rhodoferax koreensis]|nr:hypothetical protein [Rhodoferax koreense]